MATYFETCSEIWWFFFKFGRILAVENLEKHIVLAFLIF